MPKRSAGMASVHHRALSHAMPALRLGMAPGASGPGSPAPGGFPRYQYAGGWGYESDLLALEGHDTNLLPVTLQHVGARWYDPSIGRFVMRDPLGIDGGANVYAYARNSPALGVDPTGLMSPATGMGPEIWQVPLKYVLNLRKLPLTPPLLPLNDLLLTTPKVASGYLGVCGLAWTGGWYLGRGIDNGVGWVTGGPTLSERIGRGLGNLCPTCWNWVWW